VDETTALRSELAAALTALRAANEQLAAANARIVDLEQQVAKLLEEKGQNSRNSGKPPSSDAPSTRANRHAKTKDKSGRKRGGQPGHRGSQRALVPPEAVDAVVDHFPPECVNCWQALPMTPDPSPQRYQTTELPPVKPHTTEHRGHTVTCPCCKHRTAASFEIPPAFGPRLLAVAVLLTGAYHLSRRAAVRLLSDLVGVRVSLGALSTIERRVSDAVKSAAEEVWRHVVEEATVKHTDGTTWFQAGAMYALWTVASIKATAFKVLADAKKTTLAALFGDEQRGILVSDRATALTFWAMEHRQICWAHLLRKFVSFSERDGRGGVIGRELLDYVGVIFDYWDSVKVGKLSRAEFRESMAPVRKNVEAALRRAVAADVKSLSGSCENILEHAAALWTFVDLDDVEPTNNHAERELRAFVLWRRRSFGAQSERGSLFAERLMTVTHTARKQNKNVLTFLTACCTAARDGKSAPSLFAA
jgi:transposase